MADSYEFLKAHFDRIQAEDIAARVKLYEDHSVAMEFVREIAALPCTGMCGNCLTCRARRWLQNEAPPAARVCQHGHEHATPEGATACQHAKNVLGEPR